MTLGCVRVSEPEPSNRQPANSSGVTKRSAITIADQPAIGEASPPTTDAASNSCGPTCWQPVQRSPAQPRPPHTRPHRTANLQHHARAPHRTATRDPRPTRPRPHQPTDRRQARHHTRHRPQTRRTHPPPTRHPHPHRRGSPLPHQQHHHHRISTLDQHRPRNASLSRAMVRGSTTDQADPSSPHRSGTLLEAKRLAFAGLFRVAGAPITHFLRPCSASRNCVVSD
jgi:hypothetical protein